MDPGIEYTLHYVNRNIRDYVNSSITDDVAQCYHDDSPSCLHYVQVSQSSDHTYGRYSTSLDSVAMRLRLGYKYYSEVINSPAVCCKLCAVPGGHTHCITMLGTLPVLKSLGPQNFLTYSSLSACY